MSRLDSLQTQDATLGHTTVGGDLFTGTAFAASHLIRPEEEISQCLTAPSLSSCPPPKSFPAAPALYARPPRFDLPTRTNHVLLNPNPRRAQRGQPGVAWRGVA